VLPLKTHELRTARGAFLTLGSRTKYVTESERAHCRRPGRVPAGTGFSAFGAMDRDVG